MRSSAVVAAPVQILALALGGSLLCARGVIRRPQRLGWWLVLTYTAFSIAPFQIFPQDDAVNTERRLDSLLPALALLAARQV